MDIRHEEFKALTDTFLGEDYNSAKLAEVERLQVSAQDAQTRLYQKYANGRLSPIDYVNGANETWGLAFLACERVLGVADFRRLFDASPKDLAQHIDLDMFLAAEGVRSRPTQDVIQVEVVRSKQSYLTN
jgi:hypothetical protein